MLSSTENRYQYLFPFEKISPGTDILIYGAGIVGMDYLQQILITNYCHVVAMIDANAKEYSTAILPVYEPDMIHMLKFEKVVVALRQTPNWDEVRRNLIDQGVEEENIIFVQRSAKLPEVICEKTTEKQQENKHDYGDAFISIAIRLTGGLGDLIITKKVVTELASIIANCRIDLYFANNGDFIRYLYSDCDKINMIIPDLGVRYKHDCSRYDLSLEILNIRYIHVGSYNQEALKNKNEETRRKIEKLIYETAKNDKDTPYFSIIHKNLYNHLNVYTAYNFNGVFHLDDKKVNIPLDKEAEKKFKTFNLKKYITVNGASGICKDSGVISKTWPSQYMEEFIALFKTKYPDIQIVQVGDKGLQELEGADCRLLGKEYGILMHILKNSMLHVDIEGGLVHIATQLGTKCAVLFGPTLVEYYGYDCNINIRAGKCSGCFALMESVYKCARNMDEPECMYSIKPEMVLEEMQNYIEDTLYASDDSVISDIVIGG